MIKKVSGLLIGSCLAQRVVQPYGHGSDASRRTDKRDGAKTQNFRFFSISNRSSRGTPYASIFGLLCLGAGAWGGTQPHQPGGGAYGTNGVTLHAAGGVAYGAPTLTKLYPGSAGSHSIGNQTVTPGANGDGIVHILANTINFAGSIANNGLPAGAFAGSGAGGSIRLEAFSCARLTANAVGGLGNATANAAGGDGRIALYWSGDLNASGLEFSPAAFIESLGQNPTPTPTATATGTARPTATP
jgi:hypothetical protein